MKGHSAVDIIAILLLLYVHLRNPKTEAQTKLMVGG